MGEGLAHVWGATASSECRGYRVVFTGCASDPRLGPLGRGPQPDRRQLRVKPLRIWTSRRRGRGRWRRARWHPHVLVRRGAGTVAVNLVLPTRRRGGVGGNLGVSDHLPAPARLPILRYNAL
jgi:hypothetical protein